MKKVTALKIKAIKSAGLVLQNFDQAQGLTTREAQNCWHLGALLAQHPRKVVKLLLRLEALTQKAKDNE